MMTEQILRDVTELHGRLFDHRPVLQGHINTFLHEFEEKRGNRELDRLDALHSTVTEMNNKYATETHKALDTFVIGIRAKLKVAVEVCRKIEDKEDNIDVPFLDEERQRRRQTWDDFMQRQFERSAKVDEDLDREVQTLVDHYKELEQKLETVSSTP